MIGLDLVKNVFQAHGRGSEVSVVAAIDCDDGILPAAVRDFARLLLD